MTIETVSFSDMEKMPDKEKEKYMKEWSLAAQCGGRVPKTYPENATIREEYVTCGNVDCPCFEDKDQRHGPYLYAYWREHSKLKKMYLGKSMADYYEGRICKIVKIPHSHYRKFKYVINLAEKGHPIAMEYKKKVDDEEVSMDWAFRRVRQSMGERRTQMALMEMTKKGLDIDDQDAVLDYAFNKITEEMLLPKVRV